MGRLVVFALFLAANLGFGQQRYTVSDEDAAAPGSPRVVVLRDTVAQAEAAIAPSEGGELSSFRVKFKDQWIELLYHARDYSSTRGKGHYFGRPLGFSFPWGIFLSQRAEMVPTRWTVRPTPCLVMASQRVSRGRK